MSFRFNKRVKLFGGLGINIGKRGISASVRTKFGSIGTRGVSVKTGVSGLSLRVPASKKTNKKQIEDVSPVDAPSKELTKKEKSIVDIFFYIIVAPLVVVYIVLKFCLWDWWHKKQKQP